MTSTLPTEQTTDRTNREEPRTGDRAAGLPAGEPLREDTGEQHACTYSVVAMSFPIVYSLEGDHDPNGLLYTLQAYRPLLEWAREQWDDHDEYLPTLHRRRLLMEVVVDGLPRYERMREILADGPLAERYLLGEFGGEDEVLEREVEDAHRDQPDNHGRVVRQNYRATVDELVTALRELTAGRITSLTPDVAELRRWRARWQTQLLGAQKGIEAQLARINAPERWQDLFDRVRKSESDLSEDQVRRLLLNDHRPKPGKQGPKPGKQGPKPGKPGPESEQPRPEPNDYNRFNPLKPIPVVRPLVLRAHRGETVTVRFRNQIRGRLVGMHLQGSGLGGERPDGKSGSGVLFGDGAHVGENEPTVVGYGKDWTYHWRCDAEGVLPINDLGDVRGTDRGTNIHGLFAALVVEPAGSQWYDPETGERLDGTGHGDGLYVDVVPAHEVALKEDQEGRRRDAAEAGTGPVLEQPDSCYEEDAEVGGKVQNAPRHTCPPENRCRTWRLEHFVDFHYDDGAEAPQAKDTSFREFAVFFHDETETHSGIPHLLPHSAMPLSYRAEPMHNRVPYRLRRRAAAQQDLQRRKKPEPRKKKGIDHSAVKIEIDDTLGEVFWVAEDEDGTFLERVSGEEQHHSSWLFGELLTPLLRAYRGDPSRIRLVHAGVKETHVFHLHVHQWRAVAQDVAKPSEWRPGEPKGSQLLDSISIGPQTGMTIDALYGSGSRQHAVGDIIWHCHLYPHFHHGMWGIWRSYDRQVTGNRAYPDSTPCPPLAPLPGRVPPQPTAKHPGFPWFIDATFPRKSPPPPAAKDEHMDGRRQLLRMPAASDLERDAFAPGCRTGDQPGALFVDLDRKATRWNNLADVPERRIISYDVQMSQRPVQYNSRGWHDPMGHHYELLGIEVTTLFKSGKRGRTRRFDPPAVNRAKNPDAFFVRANHGDIVEWRLQNAVGELPADRFDLPAHPVECGLHVHLVKFDVLAADGSSTGWNYHSGAPSPGAIGPNVEGKPDRNVSRHRWVVDEEFGTTFFHDHLLANFRQKRGLFGALIAEPNGSRWYLPDQKARAWVGTQAVITPPTGNQKTGLDEPFREAGLALGDFVPLHRPNGEPLNAPDLLGGDDDPGVMGVNYRCAPLEYRGKDPSEWFSSSAGLGHEDDADAAWREGDRDRRRRPLDVGDTTPHLPVPRKDRGDPDTPLIWTYPGERLRLRIFQGSHEEQHSFMLNGLRWRKEWHNRQSPLVNQQTLGISEAFTVDVDPGDASPYGAGDYLWQFTVLDDLWLGCWGIIRALPVPSLQRKQDRERLRDFPMLPAPRRRPSAAAALEPPPEEQARLPARRDRSVPDRTGAPVCEYYVVARRHEHLYAGNVLTDPWGLIYRRAQGAEDELDAAGKPTGNLRAVGVDTSSEPLVLRARAGEWIKVTLINEVLLPEENLKGQDFAVAEANLPPFGPETSPPRVPVEHRDDLGRPDRRTVSPRVSLHPSLLRYDVVSHDGAYVGHNHDSTVAALPVEGPGHVAHGGHNAGNAVVYRSGHGIGHGDANWREYWWYADEQLAPTLAAEGGTGQVCYLHDFADVRNHRHHGLIGAVIVEPADVTPVDPHDHAIDQWSGVQVHLKGSDGTVFAQELPLFLQDGLRHYLHGDTDMPLPDINPSDPPVDSGQKGISYRAPLSAHPSPLAGPERLAQIHTVSDHLPIWLRLVCAGDKPRNHTFTLHGVAWDPAPWAPGNGGTRSTGGIGAIVAGFAQDFVLSPAVLAERAVRWDPGDHAYRSGAFRSAVTQGMWGILQVEKENDADDADGSD